MVNSWSRHVKNNSASGGVHFNYVAARLPPNTDNVLLNPLHGCDGHGWDSTVSTLQKSKLSKWRANQKGNKTRSACAVCDTPSTWEGVSLILSSENARQLLRQQGRNPKAIQFDVCVDGERHFLQTGGESIGSSAEREHSHETSWSMAAVAASSRPQQFRC